MSILAEAGTALHQLFGPLAVEAARATGVIARQRVFSPLSLARTFVLGFLRRPAASDEDRARVAAQCGAAVTPQAIGRRHTPKLVAFLEDLFRRAIGRTVGSDRSLAPVLDRFPEVILLDSTTIRLPDGQRDRFPGCGGSYGGGPTEVRQMVRVWARLLAAVVQHWLVVAAAWGDPTRSWDKVAEAVRDVVGGLATALRVGGGLADILAGLVAVVARTCRRDPRKKPGTAELLNDVSRLDFGLS